MGADPHESGGQLPPAAASGELRQRGSQPPGLHEGSAQPDLQPRREKAEEGKTDRRSLHLSPPALPSSGGFVVSAAQQTEEEGYVKVNGVQESLWGTFSFGSSGFSDYQSLNQALRRGCLQVLGP